MLRASSATLAAAVRRVPTRRRRCLAAAADSADSAAGVRAAFLGRRTIGAFSPRPVPGEAIVRAAEAARHAPNHKLSEPFTLRWCSPPTRARICALQANVLAEHGEGPKRIAGKMKRWSAIPEMIAVTVRRDREAEAGRGVDADAIDAGEAAFAAACGGLRAHEDKMSAAAAIQSLLVSLASEGIGSKWSTGAITRTSRFAEIVGYDVDEEVCLALVHAGYAEEGREAKGGLRRRPLEADVEGEGDAVLRRV